MQIICCAFSKGSTHDFKLFKNCRYGISDLIKILADSGYQGILRVHKNSLIPFKASKNHSLTAEEKAFNRDISKKRIFVEHVNRFIKRFKILSSRYRNRRKNFILRVSLICGFYNFML